VLIEIGLVVEGKIGDISIIKPSEAWGLEMISVKNNNIGKE
jgi:hypothetical protein